MFHLGVGFNSLFAKRAITQTFLNRSYSMRSFDLVRRAFSNKIEPERVSSPTGSSFEIKQINCDQSAVISDADQKLLQKVKDIFQKEQQAVWPDYDVDIPFNEKDRTAQSVITAVSSEGDIIAAIHMACIKNGAMHRVMPRDSKVKNVQDDAPVSYHDYIKKNAKAVDILDQEKVFPTVPEAIKDLKDIDDWLNGQDRVGLLGMSYWKFLKGNKRDTQDAMANMKLIHQAVANYLKDNRIKTMLIVCATFNDGNGKNKDGQYTWKIRDGLREAINTIAAGYKIQQRVIAGDRINIKVSKEVVQYDSLNVTTDGQETRWATVLVPVKALDNGSSVGSN